MMELEEEIRDKILEGLKEEVEEVEIQRERRIFACIKDRKYVKNVISFLREELGITHLSTITGIDGEENFEVFYHMLRYPKYREGEVGKGVEVTLKVPVPKDDPKIDSIVNIIPGASLYEREVNDMFGIFPVGHPDPKSLLLPDDWEGGHPLRKDWPSEKERE